MPPALVFALVLASSCTATKAAATCDLAKVRACYEDIMDSVPLFFASRAQRGDAAATFCSHYWEYSSCSGKAETKACRGEELVDRMERLYRQVSAELCDDAQQRLLKSFEADGDCSPLDEIRQCMSQPLDVFFAAGSTATACSALQGELVRCLSEPASVCSRPVERAVLATRSVAAFLRWYGCRDAAELLPTTSPRPVDPFLEECPFQLHEMCMTQSMDMARALLLLYGQPHRKISLFYEEMCGSEPAACRPQDSLDSCTREQRDTMHRFHLATVAAQQTLCSAPPALLANLTATSLCWDEKVFRECALGDATEPLGRHLLGVVRTNEQCRLLRSSWSGCLERSYSRLRRCEETPDVQGARGLLMDFLDRLQPCAVDATVRK
ncbi:uncharacterized protein [Dermacentor andersoni]|uniref:uncharacterized protein isoform X1 n=2 Tax=Dermacentor andersoni TaxID=34620 RepID=UPI0021551272|nr:uncharacterized protein LOC126540244 isoform X1 [Dermacentor andersoni]